MKKCVISNKKLFLCACLSVSFALCLGLAVLTFYLAPWEDNARTVTVPDYVGVREELLRDTEDLVIKREWVYSNEDEKGRVISQTPYANARRKLAGDDRREVTVYIGLGEKQARIPNLEGVDELSAARAVRELGAGVRSVAIYGQGSDGCVVGTSPAAGQRIKEGDTVTLYVSRRRVNDTVKVPDFVGIPLSEAARRALSLGLSLDADIDARGEVVAQSIPKGSRVPAGSYISFKVVEGGRGWPPIVE